MLFRKGLSEEDLIEAEINLKHAADRFRNRAVELKNQYEREKQEIISDINKGIKLDSPALISKAKRTFVLFKQALAFYDAYNNILLDIEEIKNARVIIAYSQEISESKVLDSLKNRLSPALRQAVKNTRSLTEFFAVIRRWTQEALTQGLTVEVSEEEVKEFLNKLASEATAGTKPVAESTEDLRKKLEEYEKQLQSIR